MCPDEGTPDRKKEAAKQPGTPEEEKKSSGAEQPSSESPSAVQANPTDGISLSVSASKMKATVEVDFQYAKYLSVEDVRTYIMSEGIVFGIDDNAIADIFKNKKFNTPIVAAKGKQPQSGKDGTIEYHIDVECLKGRPRVLETGSVDHRDLGLFQAVESGRLLAERIDPTQGVPGKDVYGNEVPATDGKEVKLAGGKNTNLSEDGKQLTAAIDGCLTGPPEKIEVTPALAISGDVDYKTGNISSNVAVTVSGSVLSDFTIKANEDINVNGLVEGAELVSGGRIAINAGIQGGGKALLVAEKEIMARFANEATLKAKGDIVIQGPVTHCRVSTEGSLIVEGNKAIIMGGEVYANKGVNAETVGSEMGVKTLLTVGPRLEEFNEQIEELEAKKASLEPNVKKLGQLLRVLLQLKEKTGKLPKDKAAMAAKVKQTYQVLQGQLKEIEGQIKQVASDREKQMGIVRTVNVKGTTYPGTQIRILNSSFVPKTPMKACTFALMEGEIQAFPFKDKEKEKPKEKPKEK